VWAVMNLERIHRPAAKLILTMLVLLCTVCIYRLSVMHNRTDSITSMVPSALNSGSAKALFYVFHILPEWLCIVILFAFNMREVCGTGPFGDYRDADESEVQREERRKKEAEKRMKRQPISGP